MEIDECVACICEGSAEQAIMELLLESDKLIFKEDQLLDGEILRCRSAKNFEKNHLRKSLDKKITVLRILDSRRENFKLSKLYEKRINVIDIITAPEIEMLIVIKEGKYDDFNKSGYRKPSDYCKMELGFGSVKNYKFVMEYFTDVDSLVECIQEYGRLQKTRKGEKRLVDLIEF